MIETISTLGSAAAIQAGTAAIRHTLASAVLLGTLAFPAAAQPAGFAPDPALRGVLPSLVEVMVLVEPRDRESCGLPTDVAARVYTALAEGAARRGLPLPPLEETGQPFAGWHTAIGGSTQVAPDRPAALPALYLGLSVWWTADGRCLHHHEVTVHVAPSGTMMTAQGPRPLPSRVQVWSHARLEWFRPADGVDPISTTIGALGAKVATALHP